jgi:crossover junction endodeoxyribonuclease RuvC
MIAVGIDPGLSGGMAVIDGDVVRVHDMPTITEKVGKRTRRHYNLPVLANFFESVAHPNTHAWLEKVHSMPKQGVASSFRFGEGFGLILGMLAVSRIPYTLVTPQAWKKEMLAGMPKGKGSSIVRAQQLYPDADITLKKHEARAEALLIAAYGLKQYAFVMNVGAES